MSDARSRRLVRLGVAGLALVMSVGLGGCAMQHEEPKRSDDARAGERELEPTEEAEAAPAPGAAPTDGEAPASFAEIQRELAANNAKLRALGVAVSTVEPETAKEALGGIEAKQDAPVEESRDKASGPSAAPTGSTSGSGKGAGSASSTVPDASAKPRDEKKSSSRRQDAKPAKPKAKDAADDLGDGAAEPEPAKSAPVDPNRGAPTPDLDAAGRCQEICDLSEISCSLGDQICELAERHPDEDEYTSACARAVEDCDAAKEACDACTE